MFLRRNLLYLLFCMDLLCQYSVCGSQCYCWLLILILVLERERLGYTLVVLMSEARPVQLSDTRILVTSDGSF